MSAPRRGRTVVTKAIRILNFAPSIDTATSRSESTQPCIMGTLESLSEEEDDMNSDEESIVVHADVE